MSNPPRNKSLVFIIAVLLLANIVMLAYFLWVKPSRAQRIERAASSDRFADALKKDVGFNEEQLAQFKALKDAKWDRIKYRFDELRRAKDSFFHLISVDNPGDSVLNAAADSIAERQKSLDLQAFSHFKELRKVCTDEQKPRFDSLVQRMFHRFASSFMRNDAKKIDSSGKN